MPHTRHLFIRPATLAVKPPGRDKCSPPLSQRHARGLVIGVEHERHVGQPVCVPRQSGSSPSTPISEPRRPPPWQPLTIVPSPQLPARDSLDPRCCAVPVVPGRRGLPQQGSTCLTPTIPKSRVKPRARRRPSAPVCSTAQRTLSGVSALVSRAGVVDCSSRPLATDPAMTGTARTCRYRQGRGVSGDEGRCQAHTGPGSALNMNLSMMRWLCEARRFLSPTGTARAKRPSGPVTLTLPASGSVSANRRGSGVPPLLSALPCCSSGRSAMQ